MSWKKERDALIAQTLAFVQSVARKKGDGREDARQSAWDDAEPEIEAAATETFKFVELPKILEPLKIAEPLNNPQVPPANAASDYRTEIQNRVANFRAHQERFNRERAEYFSATIAKARAAVDDDFAPRVEKKINDLLIFFSTGNRCFKNSWGFSLIGKCPSPFMIVASQPGMLSGDIQRFLRRAGIIVLAGQQKQRTTARIDLGNAAPDIAVELVEIQIAFENARAALHVVP